MAGKGIAKSNSVQDERMEHSHYLNPKKRYSMFSPTSLCSIEELVVLVDEK